MCARCAAAGQPLPPLLCCACWPHTHNHTATTTKRTGLQHLGGAEKHADEVARDVARLVRQHLLALAADDDQELCGGVEMGGGGIGGRQAVGGRRRRPAAKVRAPPPLAIRQSREIKIFFFSLHTW